MKVSIVMTAYRRAEQLRNTLISIREQTLQPFKIIVTEDGVSPDSEQTEAYCKEFGAEYYRRYNRPGAAFACSSMPINIGIKRVKSEILVLQCSECKYESADGLEKLVVPVIEDEFVTSFPRVQCLNQDGSFNNWFIHPTENPRFLNFCQALRLDWAIKIGGFDETYRGFGWEDNDFEERLKAQGLTQQYVDTTVSHQWHTYVGGASTEWFNKALFDKTYERIQNGEKPIANVDVDWGNPKG